MPSFFSFSQLLIFLFTTLLFIRSADAEEAIENCLTNVCFHDGVCNIKRTSDGTKEFECECKDGFAGDLCELKCTLPCHGGKCRRSPTTKEERCECPPDYSGPLCSERTAQLDCRHSPCPFAHFCDDADNATGAHQCEWDLCVRWGSPCSNNATCRPVKNDFICECPPGFRGRQCAEDIDECTDEGNPCQNGGSCENMLGSFRCKCPPEFTGQLCKQHVSICEQQQPCGDRGECQDLVNGEYLCRCHANYTGKNCQIEYRQCPAPFIGVRDENTNSMKCTCPSGKAGDHCELTEANCDGPESMVGKCQNGGECIRMGQKAFCICPTGFIGTYCENNEAMATTTVQPNGGDECRVNGRECLNGGRCMRNGLDADDENNYCKCKGQYTGTWCDRPLRLTAGKIPSTTTISTTSSKMETSTKEESSTTTESTRKEDSTTESNTKEESTTTQAVTIPSTTTTSTTTTMRSTTIKEESSTITESAMSTQLNPQERNATNICTPNPCQNGGVCFPIENGTLPHCHCPYGRSTGKFCQFKCHCPRHQGCIESPVQLGHVECFRVPEEDNLENVDEKEEENNVSTSSTSAFQHHPPTPTAEPKIDHCNSEPCLNGGTCQLLIDDFKCQCIAGFTGKRCEVDIDECSLPRTDQEGPTCLHGGHCLDRVNAFECNCQGTGYKGLRCEHDIDECTEATLNCQNGDCINFPGSYKCECKPGYIGQQCHIVDPCSPNQLTNETMHNCAHGECVRPRVIMGAGGRELATHDCQCYAGYTGELCMRLVEVEHAMALTNFVGLGIVVLVLCISLIALLYVFVACTRRKRANQGTYSPSSQEMAGQARFVNPENGNHAQYSPAIFHPNHHHHKPRRKH